MTKQKNFIKKILFIFGIFVLVIVIYILAGNQSRVIKNPISTVTPTQIGGEKVKQYLNKKYGFSLVHPASLDIIKETPQGVSFQESFQGESGPWVIGVTVEPVTYSDPYEKILQINKNFNDKEIKENKIQSAENFLITRQIAEKQISIDGHPAIVTYQVSVWPKDGEAYPERTVFFIKDRHLFTISTRKEENNLWNSFKFDK